MSANRNDVVNDALHSCFGPNAWPHEVIYPQLAAEAAIREIDPQQWVNSVVHRIPIWAGGKLRTQNLSELEDTCQNFCLTMIDDRPDLRYNPCKGSKNAFLSRILTYTHRHTLRTTGSLTSAGDLDLDQTESLYTDPVSYVAQRELIELGRRWIDALPANQRLVVSEALDSTPCSCPTKTVHRVRLCRAFDSIRAMADARKLRNPRCDARRLRFPRSRRLRMPSNRMVR